MPRFIGKNINNNSASFIDKSLAEQVSSSSRSGWYQQDWYSKTFNPKKSSDIKDFSAYKINNKEKVWCLDLTDQDMSNSPLKRFHQVVICGNAVEPTTGEGTNDNLIGGYQNSKDYVITAQLPNSFRYSIGSNYSIPFKSVLDFSSFNGLTSAATSGQNSALFGLATMKVWESPEPLKISLTLSCLDDIGTGTHQNTLEAIDIFSRWALPYTINKFGMYSGLPGPAVSPITLEYNKYTEQKGGKVIVDKNANNMKMTVGNDKESTRLSVLVGGMLFLDYCILENVEVNYVNTKAQYLHDYHVATFTQNSKTIDAGIRLLPVRCDITLTFSTIMGLTQTNFRNMLALRDNSSPANMNNFKLGWLQNAAGETIGKTVTNALDGVKSVTNSLTKAAYN